MKQSHAMPARVIRLPRSAGLSKTRIMALYRSHMSRVRARQTPIHINQVTTVIGTNNTWNNAQVIARDPAWAVVNNASYVWSARNLSSDNAIISKTFNIDARRSILSARLTLSVDNYAVVLINGQIVLFDAPQNTPSFFTSPRRFNIRGFLRKGGNDIVIIAFNFGGARSESNPAGVAARLNIRLSSL